MVDYAPLHGNYDGTIVVGNTIEARGAFIKVGIAMGPEVTSCSYDVNHGGTVINNLIRGINFGYGYAVNGVRNWTVWGNNDVSRHVGAVGGGCFLSGTPPNPDGFLFKWVDSSVLQPEFNYGNVNNVLGVSEPAILRVVRPPSVCGVLYTAQGLIPGQSTTSCDGRFTLVLQGDGNLVLYQSGVPLWATGTVGWRSAQAIMQADGNFVLYDIAGRPLWATNTVGNPGAWFGIQNDGNLVVYDSFGNPLWASHTAGH